MTAEVNSPYHRLTGKQFIFIAIRVVIFAIVFSFFIPHSDGFSNKVYVKKGLILADSAKVAIANYYAEHKVFPSDNAAAGFAPPFDMQDNAVKGIEISSTGTGDDAKAKIAITFNKKVYDGKSVVISTRIPKADNKLIWDCRGGTIRNYSRPAECRDSNIDLENEYTDKRSIGVLVFVLCFLVVKCVSFFIIKKYSTFKFFLEVLIALILFQGIDYIYIMYYSPFYPMDVFWIMQPYMCFIAGSFFNWLIELTLDALWNIRKLANCQ